MNSEHASEGLNRMSLDNSGPPRITEVEQLVCGVRGSLAHPLNEISGVGAASRFDATTIGMQEFN